MTHSTAKTEPNVIRLKDYHAPAFLIDAVDLAFDLAEESTIVDSHLVIRANAHAPREKNITLNGESLKLLSVALNGKALLPEAYQVTAESLVVLNVPEEFTLDIKTEIKPQDNTALSGLYKSSGNFCTQCEAHGFRRITYYLDRPDVMAMFTTKITADAKRYPILLSNGNCVEQGQLNNGKHWVRWQDPFKKPCYLFALVAGDLECVEDVFITKSRQKVMLRIYVEKGNRDKCAHAMQGVKKAMKWDEEAFGREYDLNIYMIVAVSDFNMGAMENKGLNIFNTKYILAKSDIATDADFIHVESVIAHEYFHNWSGNRVTCRDWFQLSLKEGLTIFRDQAFTADTTSKTVARIDDVNDLRTSQFPEDAGPLAHPVQPDSYIEINNFYTATIYNKGAEVIRMMKTILGDVLFRQGMDLYFSRHDGQAVTIEEFVKAMEDAADIDLTQFRLWYKQAGTPVLHVQDDYDVKQKKYSLTIRQSCPDTPQQTHKKPLHIPVKFALFDQTGQEIPLETHLLELKKAEEVFTFSDIPVKPVPSLLRDFSAPVKLDYAYTDEDLKLLFKHDTDGFNQWEAGQKYAMQYLSRLIKNFQAHQPWIAVTDFIATFKFILEKSHADKLLLAKMLILPSEKYLSEQMDVIDVDAIHAAREFLMHEIAVALKDLLLETYQANQGSAEFTLAEMGKRQLKNTCLAYLMKIPDVHIQQNIAMAQFKQSLRSNMTDALAALKVLADIPGELRETALAQFYQTWQSDALVVDKWFSIQALSNLPDTLAAVKQLTHHPAFDIKNPNKVYALIRVFCQLNMVHFHAQDGAGYEFLTQIVLTLNDLNPQIAARMITPLTEWRRYDIARQTSMRKQLETILQQPHLSKDVYELVDKSLQ